MENSIKCTVFGSFHRYKKLIDSKVEEFEKIGVEVLAPPKGPLYDLTSTRIRLSEIDFYPLKNERDMDPGQVESEFLQCLRSSDFAYLVNAEGYIGQTTSMELGFCMAKRVPIYAMEPISRNLDDGGNRLHQFENVWVADPGEAVKDYLEKGPQIRLLSSFNSMIK